MHEIDKQKFGAFVAALRKAKGMTQKELAQKLYISDKAVSKWETGINIPDICLLIPLADVLDVTVTELLECRRMAVESPLDANQVESIVKKAIRYSDDDLPKINLKREIAKYAVCVMICIAELLFLYANGYSILTPGEDVFQVTVFLSIFFGSFFLILANKRLPDYYDQNKIGPVYLGGFRMNIPGVNMNNRNWPHVLNAGRLWAQVAMVGYPVLYYLMHRFQISFWLTYEKIITLVLILGSLFIPLHIVGKKYE